MLNRWQSTIVDAKGNIQPYAVLMIRRESDQALVTIYRDQEGLQPYPAPGQIAADEHGYAYFYAPADLYRITSQAPVIDWRDVDIGAALVLRAVVDHIPEIEIVADNIDDVVIVAANIGDVNTVATNIADVGVAAANIADINTAAENIAAITDAPNQANAAATSASNAHNSELAAADSETLAHKWATNPENVVVADGEYSAYHWARRAQSFAGIPGMTFAQIDALTSDQGPIICADQDGILYAWDAGTSKYIAQTADEATALAKSSATNLITPAGLGFSLQPTLTGSATFAKAMNQIQMTDIVPTLALEVGDVIQVSGSTGNDNLYTVESITDTDKIIVNYEHREGIGNLSLSDEIGTASVKRVCKWFGSDVSLGRGWIFYSLSDRPANTSFHNSTGRGFQISARGQPSHTMQVSVDGSNWIVLDTASSTSANFNVVVPRGWYYKYTGGYYGWSELR